ncbi:Cell division protein FtsA [subsurface metagenome]
MGKYSLLGLDIGSNTIKAVQLDHDNGRYRLRTYGLAPAPPKGFESEAESDMEALSQAVKNLLLDIKVSTSNVVCALPESAVFTRVITLPILSDKELASAIHWEAEQYVPVPLDEVNLVWEVLEKPKQGKKMEVLLVAASKALGEKYIKVLNAAGLKPQALETETIAVARSLVGESEDSPTSLVISIGAKTTDVCVVKKGKIALTRSISTGGVALARAVATSLGFELPKAEEYKKSYGLLKEEMEGKIVAALKPVFDLIVAEIKRALAFYQKEKPGEQVKRAVLCGGSARLPGVVVYLAQSLGLETQIGNPWQKVETDEKTREVLAEEAIVYAVAVGLAMRRI